MDRITESRRRFYCGKRLPHSRVVKFIFKEDSLCLSPEGGKGLDIILPSARWDPGRREKGFSQSQECVFPGPSDKQFRPDSR